MKEMMLRLPVVEISSSDDLWMAKHWEKNGRYIVIRENGDVSVADVRLKPLAIGDARNEEEQLDNLSECFIGQPDLLDPNDWAPAIDLENAKLAYHSELKKVKEDLQQEREGHEAEMAEQKHKCETALAEKEEHCATLLAKKDIECEHRIDVINKTNEQTLTMRRMELEQEYEKKKLQLELETPKRFAQGEWVSGKTLTEIIKTLAGNIKEG